MTTTGNPAFVSIHELTPAEGAMLRFRIKQHPPHLRPGMNPDLVGNIRPFASQITEIESKYWSDVCRISARQQTSKKTLDRPIPPRSLQRAFVKYAESNPRNP